MRVRGAVLGFTLVGVLGSAREAAGQAAVASDLWQVAGATLVIPAPLADDGSAALWTPAVALDRTAPALRLGVEAIHAPSDVGVSGGIATLGIRLGSIGTLNGVYGRLGVDGLVRTETSPEGIGGDVPVYAEVISLGFARTVVPGLVAGAAVRSVAGQLDIISHSQLGVDLGLRYASPERFTVAFATRFFDPTFRQAAQAATYSAAASYRTPPTPMLGTTGAVTLRYGATWSHGEGMQHLLSAGLALASALDLDVGEAREITAGVAVWRNRLGLGLTVGRYRVYLARDGGVNDFGATYRFGLTTGWR
ncbi:MAG TPA: hypothetical protein VEH62_11700 [Gemmatimonadales bacterium]|nr:hypothetical protein [Gemmatimonadales bacterium]